MEFPIEMVRRVLELHLEDVTADKRELELSLREKTILQSFVSISNQARTPSEAFEKKLYPHSFCAKIWEALLEVKK